MPELPEVETVRRGLAPRLVGRRIDRVAVRAPGLRFPFPRGLAARLEGRRVVAVRRRAKYLLLDLDDGLSVLLHLGMTGRLVLGARAAPPGRHDHLVLDLDDGTRLTFADARRFGLVDLAPTAALARHPRLAQLGPEPLEPAFSGAALGARLAGRRTAIKAALMDQRTVAGIGNIYACESLYAARLSPRRLAASVVGARAERLCAAVRRVLGAAIAAGGSSLRDYVGAGGELGYFQHRFAVYDRAGIPCPGCDCAGGVRRIVQSGRATFYCPRRQR